MLQHHHDDQPTVLFVSGPHTLHTPAVLHGPEPEYVWLLVHAGHLHDQRRVQTMVNMLAPDLAHIMQTFLVLKEEESRSEQPGSLVHCDHLIQAVLTYFLRDVRALGGPQSPEVPLSGTSPHFLWKLAVCKMVVQCFCKSVRSRIHNACDVLFAASFCGTHHPSF